MKAKRCGVCGCAVLVASVVTMVRVSPTLVISRRECFACHERIERQLRGDS